jgi:thiol-disulfide isomerase/thioredoxin
VTQSNRQQPEKGVLRQDQNTLMGQQGFSFSGYERDPLYLNLQGRQFKDISGVSGLDSISDGRAAVFADFDNDGDYDVFLTAIQGETHLLFRNNVGHSSRFLRLLLEGDKALGRNAYGAVARVTTSAGVLTKSKSGGAGFLSQHDPRLLFGLGADERAQKIEVTWPDGRVEIFPADAARAGATLRLRAGTGRAEATAVKNAQLPDPLTKAERAASGLKIKVGGPMPDLALRTLSGGSVSLYKLLRPGRRALVNVWATWCAPCAKEMPELQKLAPALAARRLDLLGVSVDAEPDADVKGYVAARRIAYPIYIGGAAALENLYATDLATVPLSVVVDDKGRVLEILSGWSPETQKRLEELSRQPNGLK